MFTLPTCDHTEGCDETADNFGYDKDGKLIATFCGHHVTCAANDPNGVVKWLSPEEVAPTLHTLDFLVALAQTAVVAQAGQ